MEQSSHGDQGETGGQFWIFNDQRASRNLVVFSAPPFLRDLRVSFSFSSVPSTHSHTGSAYTPPPEEPLDNRTALTAPPRRRSLRVVICGHVDHGKSTVLGRLLADAGALPEGRLQQIVHTRGPGARVEYAFLIDALKDERSRGITIDTARILLRTPRRDYVVLDAPGHAELVKNMVTGAAQADAAILVIDASEGLLDNARRHARLVSLVGVRHVIVAVNKMDLAGFRESCFTGIEAETRVLLESLDLSVLGVVPTVGCEGDNVAERSARLPWYRGPTLLELLESCPATEPDDSSPFRMPVQDVYHFAGGGDDRRIVAGTITSGVLRAGDQIAFARSGTTAAVTQFVGWSDAPRDSAGAGEAVGFTLSTDLAVGRGDLACAATDPFPITRAQLSVRLFWTGSTPLSADRDYLLKIGTAREAVRVRRVRRVVDLATLEPARDDTRVAKGQIAECTLECARPVSFDAVSALPDTGRFVIVDGHIISGGGIVLEHGPEGGAP